MVLHPPAEAEQGRQMIVMAVQGPAAETEEEEGNIQEAEADPAV